MSTNHLARYIYAMDTLRELRQLGACSPEMYAVLTVPLDKLDLTEEEQDLIPQITWRASPEVFDAVMADAPTYIEIDPFEHEGMPPRL